MIDRIREYLSLECWSCGRAVWFCNLKHLAKDVGYGLLVGGTIGGIIGFILATINNLFFSPFGKWS